VSLPFRAAVEARDVDAMVEALAPDVKFHSPVAHTPFEGREAVRALFTALFETFEDFHYTDELDAGDGTQALIFRARVGDKQLQGLDLMRTNDQGLIHEFTVMVRPASGLMALGQAMAPKVQALK
jgi:limonene-1,2-epoxide hydrolase